MLYIFGWMLVGSGFIKAPIATGKSTPVVGMLQQQTLPGAGVFTDHVLH